MSLALQTAAVWLSNCQRNGIFVREDDTASRFGCPQLHVCTIHYSAFNVYLSHSRVDWDLTIKISDFGLARVLQEDKEYYRITPGKGNQLPIRWVALEGLTDGIFTSKSDVVSPYHSDVKASTGSYLLIQWSYGITLWEVMAIGKTPCISRCTY